MSFIRVIIRKTRFIIAMGAIIFVSKANYGQSRFCLMDISPKDSTFVSDIGKDTPYGDKGRYEACSQVFNAQDPSHIHLRVPEDWSTLSKDTITDLSILSDSVHQIKFDTSKYQLLSDKISDFLCFFTPVNLYFEEDDANILYNINWAQRLNISFYDMGVLDISKEFETRLIARKGRKDTREVYLINTKNNVVQFIMEIHYNRDRKNRLYKGIGWYKTTKRLEKNLFWISHFRAETYFSFDENGRIIWNVDTGK